jgi:hypothetical protein
VPARPTQVHHRAPEHDLLAPYERSAALATKLHAITLTGAEYQTHDYYMNIGPVFADPLARQLYAEIASVESQHITHYGSMLSPDETPLEKLVLHEAAEVYNYHCCVEQETNPRISAIWERFLDYELGHLELACTLLKDLEGTDPAKILGDGHLPKQIQFKSQREFVRKVLTAETDMRKNGTQFVSEAREGPSSIDFRNQLNAEGSPSNSVSEGYIWTPGTELNREAEMA